MLQRYGPAARSPPPNRYPTVSGAGHVFTVVQTHRALCATGRLTAACRVRVPLSAQVRARAPARDRPRSFVRRAASLLPVACACRCLRSRTACWTILCSHRHPLNSSGGFMCSWCVVRSRALCLVRGPGPCARPPWCAPPFIPIHLIYIYLSQFLGGTGVDGVQRHGRRDTRPV